MVCGDTGVAHLATALGTPSVVLFGPTAPARWGPPRERPIHRVLWAGRSGDPHAAEPDPGLLAIAPQMVIDELATLKGSDMAELTHLETKLPEVLGLAQAAKLHGPRSAGWSTTATRRSPTAW